MERVEKTIHKLHELAEKELRNNNIENSLESIAACAEISYEWNQYYTSPGMEELCQKVIMQLNKPVHPYDVNEKVVLYYDSFGFDTRGLSLIYIKAISELGFKVVYVTRENKKDKQPLLHKLFDSKSVVWEYLSFEDKYISQIGKLVSIVEYYKPAKVFMYCHPYDIAGNIVFGYKIPDVTRYKINLTDHAFWLGINSFDYCIEFRDYGCEISQKFRGIDRNKLFKLPYYPYVDKDAVLEELPFNIDTNRFVFSGGSLYKTFGEGNKYYSIVDYILNADNDIAFLYAGSGDDTELRVLMEKYPNRVYHVPERKDFFKIMQKALFYLNTYPVIGAQMTQYSVMAGKVPVTLRHNTASNGVLIDQEKLHIEFDTVDECKMEIKRLLKDKDYLERRQKIVSNSVVSEEEFSEGIANILNGEKTKYEINHIKLNINAISSEYRFRMNMRAVTDAIAKKRHMFLFRHYPIMFLRRYLGFTNVH